MQEIFKTFFNEFVTVANKLVPIMIKKLIFLALLWITYKPVKVSLLKVFNKFLSSKKIDGLLIDFLMDLSTIFIIIFYVLNTVQILGIQTASILALLGSIAVGIGLALKGTFSDFASGIQILTSKYFTKGDYIVACGTEGIVQKITFLSTVLFTGDNKLVIIPNGKLSGDIIINTGANKERRVDMVFSVAYDSSIDLVKSTLNDIVINHGLILQHKDIFIRLTKHNSSSLDFTVRVWAKKENYWAVYYDLQEIVKKRFDEIGIVIPYNTITVYNGTPNSQKHLI